MTRWICFFLLVSCAPTWAQSPTRPPDTVSANRFRFEIAGKAIPGVLKVTVGAVTIPVTAYSSGGDPVRRYLPGKPVFGSLRVEKAADSDNTLKDIAKSPISGLNARRDAALILLSPTGTELRRISFFRCLPLKYEPGDLAPPTGPLREILELAPERVELTSPNTGKLLVPFAPSTALSIKRFRGLTASKVTVDIKGTGAAVTESAWKLVKGGGIQFEIVTVRSGTDGTVTNTLGRYEPTELELAGPAQPGAHPASLAWLRDTLTGAANPRRTVTVSFYGQDGSMLGSRAYTDCLINSYSIGPFDSASTAEVEERVTIKPGAYTP